MLVASMAIGVAGLVLERTAGVLGVGCNGEMVIFRVLGRKVMAQGWKEMWWWCVAEEGAAGRGGKVISVFCGSCPTLFPVVHPWEWCLGGSWDVSPKLVQ